MTAKHEALLADLVREDASLLVVGPSCDPALIDSTYKIIGTSGSADYLRDTSGKSRLWSVSVPCDETRRDAYDQTE